MGQNGNLTAQIAVADQYWQSHLLSGLELLAQSYRYAFDTDSDCWDFAVKLDALCQFGMNYNDLRWLLLKEFVEHARELTDSRQQHRMYETECELDLHDNSCFILTEMGYDFAMKLKSACLATQNRFSADAICQAETGIQAVENALHCVQIVAPEPTPAWYAETHEFYVGESLVKEFKLPSANQETILTAFQEEGWPKRIDDPLPPVHGVDPKRRLHDTIRGLNRNQKATLIRFMADGTGEGIRWKLQVAGQQAS